MKPFWSQLWKVFDSDWGRVIPRRFGPYLLGKSLGSKGKRNVA